jgi:signal transduction histidine kinase
MYRRARLRLTVWYAATLLLVLVALGGGTYFGLVWALDREVDAGIRARVDEWRDSAPDLESLRPLDLEDHREGRAADVFLVVFRADGSLVANPTGFEAEELLERGLIRSALAGEERWATVDTHGRFRLWAVPAFEGRRIAGVVIGGRSLEARDESVGIILGVLGIVAGGGFMLALAASYVLAERALVPLRQAHERERAFVGDASHELRSPITLVRALGEVLQRGHLDADQRQTVEQLIAVTDEASGLIDDLLVLARAEEVPAVAAQVEDLAAVVGSVLERMQPLLDAHGCEVQRALESAPARVAEGDARRVVVALLENVIAHTPAGTHLLVRTQRMDQVAILVVADDGPGVPDEQIERIFERFAQAGAARTPGAAHGAGLGLAIVATVARRWGGRALARRAALGGLEVEVRFPGA